jgi:hypothetical protein
MSFKPNPSLPFKRIPGIIPDKDCCAVQRSKRANYIVARKHMIILDLPALQKGTLQIWQNEGYPPTAWIEPVKKALKA